MCAARDRKSTRLNSSHEWISYAVFCLKKKNIEDRLVLRLFAVLPDRVDENVAAEIPIFFFYHDTPTTEIYPLSLHDALPISSADEASALHAHGAQRHHASQINSRGVR